MEGDADNRQPQGGGLVQQGCGVLHGLHAVLVAEAAAGLGVISADAQQKARVGRVLRRLDQLAGAVKHRDRDTARRRVADVSRQLAAVGKHDAVWHHAQPQHKVHLAAAGTVEASATRCKRGKQPRVVVALHGVVRVHARHRGTPGAVQARNNAEVIQVEEVELQRVRVAHDRLRLLAQARQAGTCDGDGSQCRQHAGHLDRAASNIGELGDQRSAGLAGCQRAGGRAVRDGAVGAVAGRHAGEGGQAAAAGAQREGEVSAQRTGGRGGLAGRPDVLRQSIAGEVRHVAADVLLLRRAVALAELHRQPQPRVPGIAAHGKVGRHKHAHRLGLENRSHARHQVAGAVAAGGEAAELDARVAARLLGRDMDREVAGTLQPVEGVATGLEYIRVEIGIRREGANAAVARGVLHADELVVPEKLGRLGTI
mmetsp:Transcript_45616/g.116705  ORF Transcript_45616/g.116705 Transcript_45616/m.116705 type:complete len:426 (+) Transcript_45616:960-2237(+)